MMMTDVKQAGPIRTAGVFVAVALLTFAACEAPAPTATPSSDSEATAVQATGTSAPTATSESVVLDGVREIRGLRSALPVRATPGSSATETGPKPLIYIDGVRVATAAGLAGSPLDDFDPNDIESIEIIKGGAALALYGSEAAAGVIQIVTKVHAGADATR